MSRCDLRETPVLHHSSSPIPRTYQQHNVLNAGPSLQWAYFTTLNTVCSLWAAHTSHTSSSWQALTLLPANQHNGSSRPEFRVIEQLFIIMRMRRHRGDSIICMWSECRFPTKNCSAHVSINTPCQPPFSPQIGTHTHACELWASDRHPSKIKSLWTYKAVEHGAGHPSCEAHVEERQGCAWATRSL